MVPIYAIVSLASYLFWVSSRTWFPRYTFDSKMNTVSSPFTPSLFAARTLEFTSSQQDQSTPLLLVRDGYESTVLTSFFYLLLMYISPDSNEQKDVYRKVCP